METLAVICILILCGVELYCIKGIITLTIQQIRSWKEQAEQRKAQREAQRHARTVKRNRETLWSYYIRAIH